MEQFSKLPFFQNGLRIKEHIPSLYLKYNDFSLLTILWLRRCDQTHSTRFLQLPNKTEGIAFQEYSLIQIVSTFSIFRTSTPLSV